MTLKYEWKLPKPIAKGTVDRLKKETGLPGLIAQLLIHRKMTDPKAISSFLRPSLSKLGDPFGIHDMKKGTDRIKSAIKNHEKVTVYGDYDVDGITSTSIMYSLLKRLGADAHYFIPNRFKDGYGPNMDEYRKIVHDGTKLLITVDNGIAGKKEVAYAERNGMDVIITDHHDFPPKKDMPDADAIIMAKYPGHEYHPDGKGHSIEDYCGAGIAFKIAQAMLGRVPKEYLDIACLGTVADSVSLTGEDRIIVANGLDVIHRDERPGIRALANVSDIDLSKLTSTGLSFSLIPRLNSLGRMKDANVGVDLLTTGDQSLADAIAKDTERLNGERQDVMNRQAKEALKQASTPENRKKCTLVLADQHWFPGVVGIIASRVLDRYYKPTIVIGHLTADDKKGIDRGSGRSIPEFDLFKAMDPLRDKMVSFGGHPMACGLSIKPEQVEALRDGLERAGRKSGMQDVQPTVEPDLVIRPEDLTMNVLHDLQDLAPFGVDNEAPLIATMVPKISNVRQMGKTGSHLSFNLGDNYHTMRAVAFGQGDEYQSLTDDPYQVVVAGHLNLNHYHGNTYLQFMVENIAHYRYQNPVPSRKQFGLVYLYLKQSERALQASEIEARLNIDARDTDFMLKVLTGLDLLQEQEFKGTVAYTTVADPKPCHLSDSKLYREHARRGTRLVIG